MGTTIAQSEPHLQTRLLTAISDSQQKGEEMTYKIGEKYWVKNPAAGRNRMTCFTLIEWENDFVALMFNDRYGYMRFSKDNLDEHN